MTTRTEITINLTDIAEARIEGLAATRANRILGHIETLATRLGYTAEYIIDRAEANRRFVDQLSAKGAGAVFAEADRRAFDYAETDEGRLNMLLMSLTGIEYTRGAW